MDTQLTIYASGEETPHLYEAISKVFRGLPRFSRLPHALSEGKSCRLIYGLGLLGWLTWLLPTYPNHMWVEFDKWRSKEQGTLVFNHEIYWPRGKRNVRILGHREEQVWKLDYVEVSLSNHNVAQKILGKLPNHIRGKVMVALPKFGGRTWTASSFLAQAS